MTIEKSHTQQTHSYTHTNSLTHKHTHTKQIHAKLSINWLSYKKRLCTERCNITSQKFKMETLCVFSIRCSKYGLQGYEIMDFLTGEKFVSI